MANTIRVFTMIHTVDLAYSAEFLQNYRINKLIFIQPHRNYGSIHGRCGFQPHRSQKS
ncbi:MAG: hypothetical protein OXI43_16365 [Candidatus Poribacteria bacterium]|nr:hypothetical protein [Candidatus Poribacteria bacterium]